MSLFIAALFFALTPGVLVTLPPKGKIYAVAAVHALIFALIYHLVHKLVWHTLYPAAGKEGFKAYGQKSGLPKGAECQRDGQCYSQTCGVVDYAGNMKCN
jgi:hypothetical protein